MKMPRRVLVGPFVYRVRQSEKRWSQLDTDGSAGLTDASQLTIDMDPSLCAAITREVLLHELIHACWHAAGNVDDFTKRKDMEEVACRLLSGPLLQLMRDNRKLVEWLQEAS